MASGWPSRASQMLGVVETMSGKADETDTSILKAKFK